VRKRSALNIERRTQKIGFGVLVIVIVVTEMQAAALPREIRVYYCTSNFVCDMVKKQ
jgi:hypothetical protein